MAGCKCSTEALTVKIKYHNKNLTKINKIDIGDWIDLRSAENLEMKAGDFGFISLGISVQVPAGHEMHIAPRSGTFKNFGIIQTNSVGVLDESYNGDTDVVKMPVLAMRDTTIKFNDRICQFRLIPKQKPINFIEVESLGNEARGGLGSTGVK